MRCRFLRGWIVPAIFVLAAQASQAQGAGLSKAKWSLGKNKVSGAPGQTVNLQVSAEIKSGWHLYSIKTYEKDGPLPTRFTVEPKELVGLGDVILQTKAKEKMDPGFNMKVELLDGTAQFTVPLRIKPEAKPGSHEITLVAHSQACSDKTCLPPMEDKLAFTLEISDAPAPRKKREKVDWSLDSDRVTAPPGGTVQLAVKGEILPGWHVYSIKDLGDDGPLPTEFTVEPEDRLEVLAPTLETPPKVKMDPGFNMEVELLEGTARLAVPIRVKGSAPAGEISATLTVNAQACSDKTCLPPREYKIPFTLTVAGEKVAVSDEAPTKTATDQGGGATSGEPKSIWLMLWFGILGGLILNVMPCVLPVISLKIFGLVKQAGESRGMVMKHGLVYSLGVWFCFMVFAGVIIALKHSAQAVGWGFQFQSPIFVAILAAIIFCFGLSMVGVFEITMLGMAQMEKASGKEGLSGSFLHGLFATILATPCTAPFLGPALGFAFSQTDLIIIAMFTAIALGLASPFLVLAFVPAWTRFMPKPGAWMNTFKEVMGFLMLGTVIWLLSTLIKQVSETSFIQFLVFLIMVAVGCWAFGKWGSAVAATRTKWTTRIIILVVLAVSANWLLAFEAKKSSADGTHTISGIEWHPFSEAFVKKQSEEGRPVFVDATADWCATCKVNENGVIYTDEISGLLKELNYVAVKADYTLQDEAITAWLKKHGRAGVPLYVVVPPKRFDDRVVLPEILTKALLSEALKKAAGK